MSGSEIDSMSLKQEKANLISTLIGNREGHLGEECRKYANYLCSLSLNQIHQEPSLLERAEQQLAGQTQDLLCSHYGAVIASAQISAHVQNKLNQLDVNLKSVDTQLPEFSSKLSEFSEEAKHIAKRLALLIFIQIFYNKLMLLFLIDTGGDKLL